MIIDSITNKILAMYSYNIYYSRQLDYELERGLRIIHSHVTALSVDGALDKGVTVSFTLKLQD